MIGVGHALVARRASGAARQRRGAPSNRPAARAAALTLKETAMWYFSWILGIGVALGFGIINAMWLEANGNVPTGAPGDAPDAGEPATAPEGRRS